MSTKSKQFSIVQGSKPINSNGLLKLKLTRNLASVASRTESPSRTNVESLPNLELTNQTEIENGARELDSHPVGCQCWRHAGKGKRQPHHIVDKATVKVQDKGKVRTRTKRKGKRDSSKESHSQSSSLRRHTSRFLSDSSSSCSSRSSSGSSSPKNSSRSSSSGRSSRSCSTCNSSYSSSSDSESGSSSSSSTSVSESTSTNPIRLSTNGTDDLKRIRIRNLATDENLTVSRSSVNTTENQQTPVTISSSAIDSGSLGATNLTDRHIQESMVAASLPGTYSCESPATSLSSPASITHTQLTNLPSQDKVLERQRLRSYRIPHLQNRDRPSSTNQIEETSPSQVFDSTFKTNDENPVKDTLSPGRNIVVANITEQVKSSPTIESSKNVQHSSMAKCDNHGAVRSVNITKCPPQADSKASPVEERKRAKRQVKTKKKESIADNLQRGQDQPVPHPVQSSSRESHPRRTIQQLDSAMMPLDPVLRENTSPDSGILSQDDSTYGGSANTNPLEPIKLSNDCKFLLTVKSAVEANELKRKNETIDLTGIEPENKKRRRPPKKDWREHFVQSPPKDVEAATETEKTKSEKLSRVANTANSTTASLNTVNVNENDKSPFYGHVPPSICRTDTSTVVHKSNLVQITEMLLGIASSSCVKQEYSHLSIPKPTVIRSSPDLKLRQAKSLTSKKEVKSNLPDRLSATSAAITVSSSTASSNAVKSKEEDDTELCDIMKSVNASITSQFSAKTTDFRANSTNSIWRTPQKNSNHCADTNSESKKRPKMKEPGNKCSDAEKRSKSKTKSKNKSKNKSVSDRKMEMKKPKSKPKSSVIKKNTVQEKVETVEEKPASLRRSTPAPSSAAKEQKPLKPKGMKHKKGKKKSKKMDKKKKIVEKDKTRLPPEFGAKVDSLAVSLTLLKISVNTVKRRTGSQVPPEIFRKRVYHVVKNQKKKRHTEEDSYLKVMQLKRKKPQASQTKKGKQPDTVEAVKVINGQPEELISKPASDTRKRKRISPPVDDVVPKTNGIAADTPVAEVVESTVRRRSTSTANGAPAKNKKKSSVVSSTKSLTGKIKNSRKKEDSKPPGKDGKNAVTVTEVVNGKASNSTKPRESRRKSRAPVKAKITTVTKTKKPKPEPPREEVLAEKEVEPEIFLWITKPTVSTGSRTKIAKLPKVVKDVVSIPSKDFMEAGLLSSFFKRDGIDVTSDESPPIKVEDTACLPDEKTVEEANACNNLKEDVKQEAKAENGLEKSSATNEKTEDVVEVEEEEVLKIVDRMMPSYSHHDLSMSLGEFKLPYDVWLSESPSNRDVKNVEKNYTKIRSNTFSDPEFKPVGEKAHSCTCKPPNDPKKLGCDYDSNCLNRAMQIECSQSCPCKERCNNQKMRQHKWAPGLQRIMTRNRGWGVRTMDPIKKGQFVLEYIGEVVTADKFQGRMMNEYKDDPHHYCLFLDSYLVIDGYRSANEGRFVNHSCEPNCQMQKWSASGLYRVGLFANRDIKPGGELSYDYNFHSYNSESQQACLCGSEKCRGVIGGRVKPNGEKPGKEIGLTGRNRRRLLINHLQPHTKFVEQFQQHTEKFAMKKLGPKLCNLYLKKRIFLIRNYENLRQKEVAWLDGMKVKRFLRER